MLLNVLRETVRPIIRHTYRAVVTISITIAERCNKPDDAQYPLILPVCCWGCCCNIEATQWRDHRATGLQ